MTNKKVFISLASLLAVLISTQFATANTRTHVMPAQKSLVIIDSGLNTELAWLKPAVIDVACFVEFHRCPNGFSQMSGLGASGLDRADIPLSKYRDLRGVEFQELFLFVTSEFWND